MQMQSPFAMTNLGTAQTSSRVPPLTSAAILDFERPNDVLQLCPQHADDIIGGDDPGQPVVLIDDGQSLEIVFIEQLRRLVFLNAFMSENERLLRQRQHGGRGWR